ncbi:abhydrolase domain-containing protein 2 [Mytilus galloprovincialis]|uniref:Abhydrolase domain-containing protein 2 n=1 Tax=Mytilus galloprovincialis TaxID=29158 RepID=A0A8B6ELK2_MYTGA|nr:abhydrolase domain-containing protein 2 [Mytilus galloprovincialis]
MSFLLACVAGVVIYGTIRLLHLASSSSAPELKYKDGSFFASQILKMCSILTKPYIPTKVWGKSGHLQTIVYGKLGRIKSPFPKGKRYFIKLEDGATLTYDVFEPISPHLRGDYTIVISPGIANSSETAYICTFVHYAQENGYRVVVQNHLGAVLSIELSSSRMFTYGHTDELKIIVEDIEKLYPDSQFLAVGFSMGGNIVTKYLGEDNSHQHKFICGMSICQGYDIQKAFPLLLEWSHLRRMYVYFMTSYQKFLLRHHYHTVLSEDVKSKHELDEDKIFAATSLAELDQSYTIKRWGYKSLDEYYEACSSCNYINNITIPMFLLNARDDPLVPQPLLKCATQYAETHENCILMITKHGGHLGFFEGGYITPDTITWLDRAIIEFANAAVTITQAKKNLINGVQIS